MQNSRAFSTLMLLIGMTVSGGQLLANQCIYGVKNCLPNGYGLLKVRAFLPQDDVLIVPASESPMMTWGQSHELTCEAQDCQTTFEILGPAPLGPIQLPGVYKDPCYYLTIQKHPTSSGTQARVKQGFEACDYDADGNQE